MISIPVSLLPKGAAPAEDKKKKKKKDEPKSPKGQDLYIHADFIDKTNRTDAQLAKDFVDGKGGWSPDSRDFDQLASESGAKLTIKIDSLGKLLGAILDQPKRSIQTLHLMAHGARTYIGLSGTTYRSSVTFGAKLDSDTLNKFAQAPTLTINGKSIELKEIRERFRPDSVLHLMACNSGVDPQLRYDLAQFFQVKVLGYSPLIRFEPNPPDAKAPRSRWKPRLCPSHCGPGREAYTLQELIEVGTKTGDLVPTNKP